MSKKIAGILALTFLLFTDHAWAHTALKESTPAAGDEITTPLQELTLIYSTKVEENSKVTVTGTDGNEKQIESVNINQDTITVKMAEPLANDTYVAAWDIIGADGHPIKDSIEFTVNVPVTEDKEPETEGIEEEATEEAAPEPKVTEDQQAKNDEGSAVMPVIIGVAAIILAGSLWLMFRRKK
ncbi:copper resistance CopC family protein [Bacillus sp. FJAT-27916]|uniref:copper resistance CopC family protein n=1 Tax=Bacillus sp. FJAT-27916 TaxID=1679169 RepID=UPI0006715A5E|nr:copper resistance protein CopC [Bacillus sp. FJAT-27916]